MSDQDPNVGRWCRTENITPKPDCAHLGHEVVTLTKVPFIRCTCSTPATEPHERGCPAFRDGDPVVETWRELLGESSSAKLRRVEAEFGSALSALAKVEARLTAAHEALAIDDFDGDSCTTLESTIEYAIGAYRRVCESEAAADGEIRKLRAEVGRLRAELAGFGYA